MNDIFLQITRFVDENYEKTSISRDGTVLNEFMNNGVLSTNTKKISTADRLDDLLKVNFNTIIQTYKDTNGRYKITYQNQDVYSFDLYIDLNSMIRRDQIKQLSVEKLVQEQERENANKESINEKINILNEMEAHKEQVDLSDIPDDFEFDKKRPMISFQLKEQDSFEIGQTRFFSDTIDVGENTEIPRHLELVGQLNLSEFAPYDSYGFLPKTGMLYFYQSPVFVEDNFYQFGYAVYSDDLNLHREDYSSNETILNLGIESIEQTTEDFDSRYVLYEGNLEYSSFKNEELNKIYGFYTDCQMDEEDIKKVSSKYIVLLQLGSTIYGEGVTTFLIRKEDLLKRDFTHIIYQYVQS